MDGLNTLLFLPMPCFLNREFRGIGPLRLEHLVGPFKPYMAFDSIALIQRGLSCLVRDFASRAINHAHKPASYLWSVERWGNVEQSLCESGDP